MYTVIFLTFPHPSTHTDRKYCAPVNRSVRSYNVNMEGADFDPSLHNNDDWSKLNLHFLVFVTSNAVVDRKQV